MPSDAGKRRATQIREWAQFAILVFATAFGAYKFIYVDVFLPRLRPTALELTTSLEAIGHSAVGRLIRVRIVSVNRSDRRIYVPALWYTVIGNTLGKRTSPSFVDAVASDTTDRPWGQLTARHDVVRYREVVASARVYGENANWYEPHDQTTEEAVFAVPEKLYDYLVLRVEYYSTRDTVGWGAPNWEYQEPGFWVAGRTVIAKHGGRPEKFDYYHNERHRTLAQRTAAGYNWSTATVALSP